ncbi:hypothetical protein Csa_015330 [Cucumis sativus]|uniref:Uncharacterized protein n=1 Tax=Cucumis sativus TaxID=3659 RepID=A0A0A0KW17_CUCSA|nr:hypothetical protein Csa_015330 [Cucumis sativus]
MTLYSVFIGEPLSNLPWISPIFPWVADMTEWTVDLYFSSSISILIQCVLETDRVGQREIYGFDFSFEKTGYGWIQGKLIDILQFGRFWLLT